jgi:hypothetical protein
MSFGEIKKAIAWNDQATNSTFHNIVAYFTLHNGLNSPEPTTTSFSDQVWYATGFVYSELSPTPRLVGTLKFVMTTSGNGEMEPRPGVSVSVEIYPDGKFTFLRRLNGKPIGGMPPTEMQMVDVGDVLLTGVDGNEVITIGVNRQPEEIVPPN